MPKLPSHLSDSELLELLDSPEEVASPTVQIFDYEGDIVPFMGFYNITPGESLVSKKLLYKLYKAYSKEPLDIHNFNIQMGKYLSPGRDHFHINLDQFAISSHIYESEKKRDKTKHLTFQKHFEWFLTQLRVERGSTWIEGYILFHQYKDFCKERRVNPKLGYVNFHKFLKLHFQYKRINENRSLWFRVDEVTANHYTEEEKNVIRDGRKEAWRGKKKINGQPEETPTE